MDPVRAIYLAALCLIVLGVVLSWQGEEIYTSLLILPALLAAAAYSLAPQLRWWHWKRNPPDLPTSLAPLLDRFPLYRALDAQGKRDFRRRAFLLREATAFQGLGVEAISPDVELMVAGSAASVTFFRKEFQLAGFENVVFYPHLFPSPQYERLHSSEMYAKDGVIIWTIKYFVRSVVEPDKYLQLGIYEYSRALLSRDDDLRTLADRYNLEYSEIHHLTGFSEEKLKEFIGLPELDRTALTLTVLHTHAPKFNELFPDRFAALSGRFLPTQIL